MTNVWSPNIVPNIVDIKLSYNVLSPRFLSNLCSSRLRNMLGRYFFSPNMYARLLMFWIEYVCRLVGDQTL